MSIASTLQDTKARLDSLLSYANETTGQSDVSIGDAIKTLVDGFGQGGGGGSVGLQNATYTDYQITEDKNDVISLCRLFLDDDLQDGAEQNHSFYVEIVGDRSEYLSAEYKFLNAMIYRSATVTDGYTVNAYYFRNGAYGVHSGLTYKLDATFVRNVKIKAGETMRVWKIVV